MKLYILKAFRQFLTVALLFTLCFSLSIVSAQESVNTTGGEAMGSGGTASYSVGQVFYDANAGTNGFVIQGVQQPYEISVVSGIDEAKGITLTAKAYPNPTTDYLTLEVSDISLSSLSYYLYDMSGKLLQRVNISSNQTSIAMRNLPAAVYFVKVVMNQEGSAKEVKTFKIVKD